MHQIFISYRRLDCADTVKLIRDYLVNMLPGWKVFYDHQSIEFGEVFPERIQQAVTEADVVVVVMGPRWLELLQERSRAEGVDYVREEVRMGLAGSATTIPVLVQGASVPRPEQLAEFPELLALPQIHSLSIRPDPDFMHDIERLVAHLERKSSGPTVGSVVAGRYKLLQEIGAGGMGVVYKARHLQTHQDVAVKLIKPGMDSREVLARFEAERAALGMMDHPGIARVIDAGKTAADRPFFVMEYVAGQPITEYCDQHRLTVRQRLKLIQDVCEAVQHAHQKGIIHRDLKPGNVLATTVHDQPVIKVIDFGLAKALGAKLTTHSYAGTELGRVVGSLLYSSPEQAAGRVYEIDTRTDVYSLGVLLYELLIGEPPFSADELAQVGEDAIKNAIIHNEPKRASLKLSSSHTLPVVAANRSIDPRRLTQTVRGELEWIINKALEKQPADRYPTTLSLADEINRYLTNQALSVGRPGTFQQWVKFYRRNRGRVTAALVLAATLMLGLAGTLIGLVEARHQTAIANQAAEDTRLALAKERDARDLAERRWDEKREAIDGILATFSDEELKAEPGSQPIRRKMLLKGLAAYQELLTDRAKEVPVLLQSAATSRELGQVVFDLGDSEGAHEYYQQAVLRCREAVAAAPSAATEAALVDALVTIGQWYFLQGQSLEAQPLAEECILIARKLHRDAPDEPSYQGRLGRALTFQSLGLKGPQADAVLVEAIDVLERAIKTLPNEPEYLSDLGRAYGNCAANRSTYQALDAQFETFAGRAITLQQQAIAIRPTLVSAYSRLSRYLRNRIFDLTSRQRIQESLDLVDQHFPQVRSAADANPTVPEIRVALADLLYEKADLAMRLGQTPNAIALSREEIQIRSDLVRIQPQKVDFAIRHVEALHRLARMQDLQDRAVTLQEIIRLSNSLMLNHPRSGRLLALCLDAYYQHGDNLRQAARPADAIGVLEDSIHLYTKYHDPLGESVSLAWHDLLNCGTTLLDNYRDLDKYLEVIELSQQLKKFVSFEQLKSQDDQNTYLRIDVMLADVTEKLGRLKESLALRIGVRDRARELLQGDPTSNWYLYQIVFGAHHHIARVARVTHDEQIAFDALRDYFTETEPYVWGVRQDDLIARTAEFNPQNLEQLRKVHDAQFKNRALKRFTVPVDFNGIKSPFFVYVAESWEFTNDQFLWVERVRGGQVPDDIRTSFRKLFDIARENKVSFQELIVYALGTATTAEQGMIWKRNRGLTPRGGVPGAETQDPVERAKQLARFREEAEASGQVTDRIQLCERYTRLVEDHFAKGERFQAEQFLGDARSMLEDVKQRLSSEAGTSLMNLEDYVEFLNAISKIEMQNYVESYAKLIKLNQRPKTPGNAQPLTPPGGIEFALGWICEKENRPLEATTWYQLAHRNQHPRALQALYFLWGDRPEVTLFCPSTVRQRLEQAKREGSKEKPAAIRFQELFEMNTL